MRNKFIGVNTIEEIDALARNKTLKNFGMSDEQRNCLAISRDFICATEFPKCEDKDTTESPMCGFYCQLWIDRCPEVSEFGLIPAGDGHIQQVLQSNVQKLDVHGSNQCSIKPVPNRAGRVVSNSLDFSLT